MFAPIRHAPLQVGRNSPLFALEQHHLTPCQFAAFVHEEDFLCVYLRERCRVSGRIEQQSFEASMSRGEMHLIGYETEVAGELRDSAEVLLLSLNRQFIDRIKQDIAHPTDSRIDSNHQLSDPLIYSLCLNLHKEFASEQPSRFYIESLALALGTHLIRHYSACQAAELTEGALSPQQLYSVREYIEGNLATDLDIETLANLINFSPYYFARLFKQAMGTTPYAYIVERRIETAKRLLRTTYLPIEQIAASVGYSSPSHFSRLFKQHVDLSPRVYRRETADAA